MDRVEAQAMSLGKPPHGLAWARLIRVGLAPRARASGPSQHITSGGLPDNINMHGTIPKQERSG